MTATKSYRLHDRSNWKSGPWDTEPDHVQWIDRDSWYPCIAHRQEDGYWCGYVGVPPSHPYYGHKYDKEGLVQIEVHGGLTYSAPCNELICHTPRQGEQDHAYWFGFDCSHYGDLMHVPLKVDTHNRYSINWKTAVYRDLAYVRAECMNLAKQLHAIAKAAAH